LEKDEERQTKLEQLENDTKRRVELLQQRHSDKINTLSEGTTEFIIIIIIIIIIDMDKI